MEDLLELLLQEEKELQFESFNEDRAWRIGCALVEDCRRQKLPVTVDIRRGSHQLFHASLPGTSPDNDEWVLRKVRLVTRFGHSSYYMGQLLKSRNKRIEEMYLLPESEYAPHGGCVPILIRNCGMIGTITVSGLAQQADHQLVVDALRADLALER